MTVLLVLLALYLAAGVAFVGVVLWIAPGAENNFHFRMWRREDWFGLGWFALSWPVQLYRMGRE